MGALSGKRIRVVARAGESMPVPKFVTIRKCGRVEIPRHPKGRPMFYAWVQGWAEVGSEHASPLNHWRASAKANGFKLKYAKAEGVVA